MDDETHNRAVMLARVAEQQAIDVAELSVQELVDCDTYADQGCVGGNPLLAFYFIHRYGLTSAAQYPYTGQEEACRLDLVSYPIASVQSWGILTPNHEDNMESVLRQLGPIAVGIDGADPAFMSYSEGIFESTECDQTANHALLIVGHGHEVDKHGRTVRCCCMFHSKEVWMIFWYCLQLISFVACRSSTGLLETGTALLRSSQRSSGAGPYFASNRLILLSF